MMTEIETFLADDLGHWRELLLMVGILVLAWVVLILGRRVLRLLHGYLSGRVQCGEDSKRIDTLLRAFRYVLNLVVVLVAGMLILSVLGISIAPILGAAGVVGIAVGFGAQSLFKDFFSGFFILLENQIRQGDVVEVCGKGGLVEEVTLRYIRLRDYEGSVHYIPNGLITTITSRSYGFAYSVIDLGIAYRENVEQAFALMREVGQQMREDSAFQERILENIDIAGVESWADSAIILRCRFKTVPLAQWDVRREFLKRMKRVFDQHGIEIPFPHLTIYAGQDKQGTAPPFVINRLQATESSSAHS